MSLTSCWHTITSHLLLPYTIDRLEDNHPSISSGLVLYRVRSSRLTSDTLACSVDIAGKRQGKAPAPTVLPVSTALLFANLLMLYFLPLSSTSMSRVCRRHSHASLTPRRPFLWIVSCLFSSLIFSSLVGIALMILRVLPSPPSLLWRGGNLVSPPPEASCHCSQSMARSVS